MKKWTLYRYIIGLLTCLLASCGSGLPDEEITQPQDQIGVQFTLSMGSIGATSRAVSNDAIIDQYENVIDPTMFRVFAYSQDDKVHEVTIFSITKGSEVNSYNVLGELKGSHSIKKVVVLANCDNGFNPLTSSLGKLTYSYTKADFNPITPSKYIPMWGVKTVNASLNPGTSTHLGTIDLLRAMAKVHVALSDKSTNCELSKVTISQCNNSGACVPSVFNDMPSTGNVESVTIPNGVSTTSNVDFHKIGNMGYILYLPEHSRQEGNISIAVSATDINGDVHNGSIQFGKYEANKFANTYWDILRNNYYKFEVLLMVDENGKLNLHIETEQYAAFDELRPEYGE